MVAAEKETKRRAGKNGKKKGKTLESKTKSNRDIEQEAEEQSGSDAEDCIIVDMEWMIIWLRITPQIDALRH